MRAKHLFWIVPVLILVFALFPQGSSWEDEWYWRYKHPFPGLWVYRAVSEISADYEFIYHAQLIVIRWSGRHVWHDPTNGSTPALHDDWISRNLIVEVGWQLQNPEETVARFMASSNTMAESLSLDWYFLPDFGDPPWRPPVIQTHFMVWAYMDDPGGKPQWFRTAAFSLNSSIFGAELDDCRAIYLTRGLESDYFRAGAGCFVYPSEDTS